VELAGGIDEGGLVDVLEADGEAQLLLGLARLIDEDGPLELVGLGERLDGGLGVSAVDGDEDDRLVDESRAQLIPTRNLRDAGGSAFLEEVEDDDLPLQAFQLEVLRIDPAGALKLERILGPRGGRYEHGREERRTSQHRSPSMNFPYYIGERREVPGGPE
jgi:hypothetical protein